MTDGTSSDGRVSLRVYIERLFEERTQSIMTEIRLLNEKIDREREHLDTTFSTHLDQHSREYATSKERLNEINLRIEQLDSLSRVSLSRDAIDERFSSTQEQLHLIERELSELRQSVHDVGTKRDTWLYFLGIGFTVVNLVLAGIKVFG